MSRVNIEIPDELHKKAKVACAVNSITLIDFINKAVEDRLKREKIGKS
jgi:hypothetical protein